MISPRLLPRSEWESALREIGCRPLEGTGPLNTAEWWITEWGFAFTVPVEGPDDRCEQWSFARFLDDINRTRPDGSN